MVTKTATPPKMYAVVLADGTPTEFKTKRQAVLCGESSGQDFSVLSPRGFEVHIGKAAEPTPTHVLAKSLEVGMVATGTTKREPQRKIARMTVGKSWVTCWDKAGKCFLYVRPEDAVEIQW